MQQRYDHGERKEPQQNDEEQLKDMYLCAFSLHHHTPDPVVFLEKIWVVKTNTIPTTPLTRLTAVANEY